MTYRVTGIGEVLWDRFPDGDRLGGAPANFAFHAGQMGAAARIISRVGADDEGSRIVELLDSRGLSTELLQKDPLLPTGIVRVALNEGQPTYTIESPAAWDNLEWSDELERWAVNCDAVCFGTLAQRAPATQATIRKFLEHCPKQSVRIFDLNFRAHFYSPEVLEFGLRHASILKLNHEEAARVASMFSWPRETLLVQIFSRYPVDLIAVTAGAAGCEIRSRHSRHSAGAPQVVCVDAVGAGDAFCAALAMGVLEQRPLEQIAERANRVGAYVATQAGGMPTLPAEIVRP